MPSEFRKEKLIKEQRLMEANKENYIGVMGKFGIIARFLGTPIMSQGGHGGWGMEENDMDFDFWNDNEDAIPLADDVDPHEIGWLFDGLSRGYHIEVKYMDADHTITVYYKGFKVYEEMAGELLAFAPFKEWQTIIETLYKQAEKKRQEEQELDELELAEENQAEALSLWQQLRFRWGI